MSKKQHHNDRSCCRIVLFGEIIGAIRWSWRGLRNSVHEVRKLSESVGDHTDYYYGITTAASNCNGLNCTDRAEGCPKIAMDHDNQNDVDNDYGYPGPAIPPCKNQKKQRVISTNEFEQNLLSVAQSRVSEWALTHFAYCLPDWLEKCIAVSPGWSPLVTGFLNQSRQFPLRYSKFPKGTVVWYEKMKTWRLRSSTIFLVTLKQGIRKVVAPPNKSLQNA